MMNMRSYHGKKCRATSMSYDGGETWSEVVHAPELVESICQGSIIEFGKYQDRKLYLFSNPAVPYGRTHMTIKSSFDDCQSWSNAKLIYAGPSAYSCLANLPNGNIGLFFESGESNPYENLIFLSFEPELLFEPGFLIDNLQENE